MSRGSKGSTPVCSVDGCQREAHGQGLCGKHYQRYKKSDSYKPAERITILRPLIEMDDGSVGVPLTRGHLAIVDESDREFVSQYNWHSSDTGGTSYPATRIKFPSGKARPIGLHRMLMGVTDPDVLVDHIDGDTFNNRRSNLRVTDHTGNARNARSFVGVSRFKGLSRTRSGRWTAAIWVDKKKVSLGTFDDERHAAIAYNEAAVKYHGEFAVLNVVD